MKPFLFQKQPFSPNLFPLSTQSILKVGVNAKRVDENGADLIKDCQYEESVLELYVPFRKNKSSGIGMRNVLRLYEYPTNLFSPVQFLQDAKNCHLYNKYHVSISHLQGETYCKREHL